MNFLNLPCTINVRVESWNFSIHNPVTSNEESVKYHTKSQESSKSSDNNKNKKTYTPYEEIFWEFKKINTPMSNREIKKEEEEEICLSEMKK